MSRGRTIHFLLTYDRTKRRLVEMERFRNGRKAVDRYEQREHQYADKPHLEVVLLGADSEEAIRYTHPTYFRDFEAEPFLINGQEVRLPWMKPKPSTA